MIEKCQWNGLPSCWLFQVSGLHANSIGHCSTVHNFWLLARVFNHTNFDYWTDNWWWKIVHWPKCTELTCFPRCNKNKNVCGKGATSACPQNIVLNFILANFDAVPGSNLVILWTFMDISRWFVISNIDICLHKYVTTTKPNLDSFQGLLIQEKRPIINRNDTI